MRPLYNSYEIRDNSAIDRDIGSNLFHVYQYILYSNNRDQLRMKTIHLDFMLTLKRTVSECLTIRSLNVEYSTTCSCYTQIHYMYIHELYSPNCWGDLLRPASLLSLLVIGLLKTHSHIFLVFVLSVTALKTK